MQGDAKDMQITEKKLEWFLWILFNKAVVYLRKTMF